MDNVTFEEMARRAREALKRGDTTTALNLAEQLIKACKQENNPDEVLTLGWRAFRAKVLTEARRYLEAEAELAEVLLIREQLEGVDSPGAMRVRGNLARAIALSGRTEEALLAAHALLADRRRILGDLHPETLDAEGHIAHFTYLDGDAETAAQLYSILLEKRREVLGRDHPVTRQTEQNLVAVSSADAGLEGLEELRAEARRLELSNGPDHVDTMNALAILAERLASSGECSEALELAQHVLASRERMLGSRHIRAIVVRHTAARALAGLGRNPEAFDELREILSLLDNDGMGSESTTIRVMCDIIDTGGCLLDEGELEEEQAFLVFDVWDRLAELESTLPPDHRVRRVRDKYAPMFETDVENPATNNGTIHGFPIPDPGDARHRHHWEFAFVSLPSIALSDRGDRMFQDLAEGDAGPLQMLWLVSGGAPEDASQISVHFRALASGNQVVVISMPPVKASNEAIFVALVREFSGQPERAPSQMRIVYLETGMFSTMIGESSGVGHHVTHGVGCDPELDAFVDIITSLDE